MARRREVSKMASFQVFFTRGWVTHIYDHRMPGVRRVPLKRALAACSRQAMQYATALALVTGMPPRKVPSPDGVSYDGRSANSKYWGASNAKVRMCPHVKHAHDGGGLCGLDPDHCLCWCLCCGRPMRARKRCKAVDVNGNVCGWGADRSSSDSSPEQSPPRPRKALSSSLARKRGFWKETPTPVTPTTDAIAPTSTAPPPPTTDSTAPTSGAPPAPAVITPRFPGCRDTPWFLDEFISPSKCLPNLVPGGPDNMPRPTPRRRRAEPAPKAWIKRIMEGLSDVDDEPAVAISLAPPCHPPAPTGE
jgi:hypothetical protein